MVYLDVQGLLLLSCCLVVVQTNGHAAVAWFLLLDKLLPYLYIHAIPKQILTTG